MWGYTTTSRNGSSGSCWSDSVMLSSVTTYEVGAQQSISRPPYLVVIPQGVMTGSLFGKSNLVPMRGGLFLASSDCRSGRLVDQ